MSTLNGVHLMENHALPADKLQREFGGTNASVSIPCPEIPATGKQENTCVTPFSRKTKRQIEAITDRSASLPSLGRSWRG